MSYRTVGKSYINYIDSLHKDGIDIIDSFIDYYDINDDYEHKDDFIKYKDNKFRYFTDYSSFNIDHSLLIETRDRIFDRVLTNIYSRGYNAGYDYIIARAHNKYNDRNYYVYLNINDIRISYNEPIWPFVMFSNMCETNFLYTHDFNTDIVNVFMYSTTNKNLTYIGDMYYKEEDNDSRELAYYNNITNRILDTLIDVEDGEYNKDQINMVITYEDSNEPRFDMITHNIDKLEFLRSSSHINDKYTWYRDQYIDKVIDLITDDYHYALAVSYDNGEIFAISVFNIHGYKYNNQQIPIKDKLLNIFKIIYFNPLSCENVFGTCTKLYMYNNYLKDVKFVTFVPSGEDIQYYYNKSKSYN